MRWSDGSRQLLLGDEVLDVAEQDVAGDHHYLFVRHQGLIQVRPTLHRAECWAVQPDSRNAASSRLARTSRWFPDGSNKSAAVLCLPVGKMNVHWADQPPA